jgi:hypothetical protein
MKYKVVSGSLKLGKGKFAVANTKSAVFDSADYQKVTDENLKKLDNVVPFVESKAETKTDDTKKGKSK